MSSELRPLQVWGTPRPGDVELIKAAKISLDLPYKVTLCQAVPGWHARVLALREPPPFIQDYFPVRYPEETDYLRDAVAWTLDDTIEDARAVTVLQQFQRILGPDVIEVTGEHYYDPEEMEALYAKLA